MSLRQRSSASIPNEPPTNSSQNDVVSVTPPPQSALAQALRGSANLANLLPTGTLLAFQLLTPIFTNGGACDAATRPMTFALLLVLALSCFLASFTDSLRCANGEVHYGFATREGLWLFDSPDAAALPDLRKFRLNAMDVVHAFVSVMVFVAVALRDKNAVGCFYPRPAREVQEVLDIAPIGIGLISSLLFVVFPSRRNGIGYPVTRDPMN
ncbi:protein DMP3-like [Salvia miltiorrhiza]|uniref:protein DMP3-like n=1 Tax=Salvia miltiorrhiza TaxID=226208 RepID=UPI0025AC82A9|nr:protein DMP3-like [Salvia miltiorrhiza]